MDTLNNTIYLYKQLNNVYKDKFNIFSEFKARIHPITTFSGNGKVKLPFKIKGRLITSGKYKDGELGEFSLPPEELKKSVSKWNGIKIYSSHKIFQEIMNGKEPSIKEVLGRITFTEWNNKEDGIDFYADVYDEDAARKINAGLIDSISAGFSRDIDTTMNDNMPEFYLKNIEPGEASMVFNPRDIRARFQPVQS